MKGTKSYTKAKEWDIQTTALTPDKVRDLVLIRRCPEESRLAIASEIIKKTRRLPVSTLEAEFFAYEYVESALARR